MAEPWVYDQNPSRVYWEITRSCDLACRHCRAEAAPFADPNELDTAAGIKLLTQLATAKKELHVILTGGDPLKRADLFTLIETSRKLGMGVSVSPSGTPLLTDDAIDRLEAAGVEAISLSLDGSTAERHDSLRGVPGCMERTERAARRAAKVGLAFQVNSLVAAETVDDLPAIYERAKEWGATRWSLFFLVSVGRGTVLQPISAERCERLLEWLADRAAEPGPVVTTTEAPHFRRILAEHHLFANKKAHHRGAGMRDGNGVMFISHDGDIYPSGFLPLLAGNVKEDDPLDVYRNSPLFRSLRATETFKGRCGDCEFRAICGGSRSRSYSANGDPLAEDPLCLYVPHAHAHANATAKL
jgi:radical SAM protein with 4Fe4S-binding SPASM domain